MAIRKTLISIVLAGALALGVAGCKDNNSQSQPKQNIFPYTQAGQIAEVPHYYQGGMSLTSGDFDGDGDLDFILGARENMGRVYLFKNDGQGNFTK